MSKLVGWAVVGALLVALAVLAIQQSAQRGPAETPAPGGPAAATPGSTLQPPVSGGVVQIEIASSNTKEGWMNAVTQAFNAQRQRDPSGNVIQVKVEHVSTGESMEAILTGKSKLAIWSPADRFWLELLNSRWRDQGHRDDLVRIDAPASVTSPLVVAMWRPMAQALGWPDKPVGWQTIFGLATDPAGWGRYGHPEWGRLRLAHGHGELANSGRLSLLSQAYAATGKTSGLNASDLRDPRTVEFVGRLQDAVVSYGPSDKYLLDRMAERGPSLLSAVVTYEVNVALYNDERGKDLSFPLVSVYPSEGTFWTEHPLAVVKSEWVTEEQSRAAAAFVEFALSSEQLGKAPQFGLRGAEKSLPLTAPLDDPHGAIPGVTREQIKPLMPLATSLDPVLRDLWLATKKKAVVALVFDKSGSMAGEKIRSAREGAIGFIDAMADGDEIIFISFSTEVTISPRSGRVGDVREELRREVETIFEGGSTALHRAILESLRRVEAARGKYGEQRLYSVVLLSDGQNTQSSPTWSQVLEALPSTPEITSTRIITIAYGADADEKTLLTLATRTEGALYKATATNIRSVYLKAAQY